MSAIFFADIKHLPVKKQTIPPNLINLFKATIKYIDNNNESKSLDIAVIVPTNSDEAYIMAPYDNYTGSTSFVKGFTDLYSEDSE